MVEAMACGCAVIAADCKSGPREILLENADLADSITEITDADYGILIPALEPEENWDPQVITEGEQKLARALAALAAEPQLCEKLAQQAQARSRDFDFTAARNAFCRVIEAEPSAEGDR